MIVNIKNIQYFEWKIPKELVSLIDSKQKTVQEIIDEHFNPDDISSEQTTDDWYEVIQMSKIF